MTSPLKLKPKELQIKWKNRKKIINREVLRGILKFKVGRCDNLKENHKCKLAIHLDDGETCAKCCVFCKEFLVCYSSFTCPLIKEEVEKVLSEESDQE